MVGSAHLLRELNRKSHRQPVRIDRREPEMASPVMSKLAKWFSVAM
jgi:hypothetical protein